MSEYDHDHDHNYAVVVRPYARVRIGADTDERGLDALSVTIDYNRSGVSAPGAETDVATSSDRDVERRGFELAIYRDGMRLFDSARNLDLDMDTSEALGYVDDLAVVLGRLSRRLR